MIVISVFSFVRPCRSAAVAVHFLAAVRPRPFYVPIQETTAYRHITVVARAHARPVVPNAARTPIRTPVSPETRGTLSRRYVHLFRPPRPRSLGTLAACENRVWVLHPVHRSRVLVSSSTVSVPLSIQSGYSQMTDCRPIGC